MSVLKKYTCRICITHEGKIYKLFSIGYYPDGGYFITDLSQVNGWNYIASKIHYNPIGKERRKSFLLPIDYNNTYYFGVRNPKISHHIDGKAHISGNGIKSGYDSNGEAKGLSIKSGSLHKGNDGGPMFIFNIGVNSLKNFTEITLTDEKLNKNMHLLLNQEMLVDLRKNNDHKYNYLIEGYLIHKNDLPEVESNEPILFFKQHPSYHLIPLVGLSSPKECPYVFAVGFIADPTCHNPDLFSYTGAPGIIDNLGGWDSLLLTVTKEKNLPFINLEYETHQ